MALNCELFVENFPNIRDPIFHAFQQKAFFVLKRKIILYFQQITISPLSCLKTFDTRGSLFKFSTNFKPERVFERDARTAAKKGYQNPVMLFPL